jgi:hypothetical protein
MLTVKYLQLKHSTQHNFRERSVMHLVAALRYKPEGLGLDSRRGRWNF